MKRSLVNVYKWFFNLLNKYIFLNHIILVIHSEHEAKDQIFERLNYYFNKNTILIKYKYDSITIKLFAILPILKVHFGIDHTDKKFISNQWLFYNIDPNLNPLDAWEYHTIISLYRKQNKINYIKFKSLLSNIKDNNKNKCYLFATGKSLSNAINHRYDDGNIIVCNTIVKDEVLWKHLKPDIIVAGDALYHFSDSKFAIAFRKDLKKRLSDSNNTFFIFPVIFEQFIYREFSEFKERLIGIPIGKSRNITDNLLERFELPSFGNVLNLLMLPIACTISKNIFFWGFDGRAPLDKDFWENSNSHFYQEHIDELKLDHQAFFNYHIPKGNENKYVNDVHGDILENELSKAEKENFKFVMMHFSHTNAFQKRYNND